MNIFTLLETMWSWFVLVISSVIVVPSMWIMAYLYSTWEKWIKESDKMAKKWDRIILIIPLTFIVILALIIYRLLHKWYEGQIKERWGLKLF